MTEADISALVKGLAPVFRDALTGIVSRLAVLETKEKGLDGKDGKPGPAGPAGEPGRDGRDGVPGPQGEKGINGLNGKDGADGLGHDDLKVLHDGERTITFRYIKGDQIKEFAIVTPTVLDRGVWIAGKQYDKGDGVTWDGAWWIAQAVTKEKPGAGATAWRLAVKRGEQGKPGPEGKAGRDGKDLTQMDTTGRKW